MIYDKHKLLNPHKGKQAVLSDILFVIYSIIIINSIFIMVNIKCNQQTESKSSN